MHTKRYLQPFVQADLNQKMVFMGGPRQVGKTTMALGLLREGSKKHPAYLNWDVPKVRRHLQMGEIPSKEPLIVLDEIHKFARWRNLVKGFYDIHFPDTKFLVTGSARLDYYRKGGDSLQGRYHYYRLHPFTTLEISKSPSQEDIRQLLKFSGFPEPFFANRENSWRRWQRERLELVLYDDLRDLEKVRELSLIELLIDALPERIGSPLSIKSLREELEVAHYTVENWLAILERLYFCFRISPYGSPKIRAVKKEQKLYFWDWSLAPETGPRFENFVAGHLLKYCHFIEDTQGHKMELRFLRDTDKREVDFVVVRDKKPLFAVECKTGERSLSPAIKYFSERTPIARFYQVHLGDRDHGHEERGGRVLPWLTFCRELGIP